METDRSSPRSPASPSAGGGVQQSSIKPQTLHPTWQNESFDFTVRRGAAAHGGLLLQVEVWDHDKYKVSSIMRASKLYVYLSHACLCIQRSDFIGEVSIDLGAQLADAWAAGAVGPLRFDLCDAHNRLGEQERLRKQVWGHVL